MSILRRIVSHPDQSEERATDLPSVTTLDELARIIGGSSATVSNAATITAALGHPTVWRSVNKIAGMFVQMPTRSYRGNVRVDPQPPVVANPSPGMFRPLAWKRAAAVSMLLRGNAYGWVSPPDRRGIVQRCDLIHPDRVTFDEASAEWRLDGKVQTLWPLGSFWQVPFMTLPGCPKGLNPIEYARRTTYAGLAAQEFGGNFFRDGAHPTGLLQPETDPGEKGAIALKKMLTDVVSGTKRDPLVIPQSTKWTPIQVNPEDSQFIELMQFTGGQVAGFFGLDPAAVGLPSDGGSMEYSNRENRQQDVLQDAVMPLVLPLDEAMSDLVPNGQVVRSTPEGLLRADTLTRYRTYMIAAQINKATGGTLLDVNTEMRPLENRDPLEGKNE